MSWLCLSRRPGEQLIFDLPSGETITLEVVGVRCDGLVRLGIQAPKDVKVWRKEVKERMAKAS